MKIRSLLFSMLAVPALAAAAHAAEADSFLDIARNAIARGYGGECSLEMKPVQQGGYYPCIDVDPYRIVFTYGGSRVFVVQKGKKPFPIFEGSAVQGSFTVAGPWQQDLPARIALWWADTVDGASARAKQAAQSTEEKQAAEEYVNRLMGKKKDTPPQAAPASAGSEESPSAPPVESSEISPDIREILSH